jgi:excisionase family DNA binding protein
MQKLLETLLNIKAMLAEQVTLTKKVLNLKEAARYLDLSESAVYRLTSERRINFFKPEGKKIFFRREDLENWMLSNPIPPKVASRLSSFKRG